MSSGIRRRRLVGAATAAAALVVGSVSLGTSTALGAGNGPDPRVERARTPDTTQVVTVDAPTRAARTKVTRLGLDVT